MAEIYAVQNGNWSDGSTWSSGSVPTADDDVYLNGKTVNVSTNLEIHNLSNVETVGLLKGGNLVFDNGDYTIECNVINSVNNIITFNNAYDFYINCKKLYSKTEYAVSTQNKIKQTLYGIDVGATYTKVFCYFNGDIETDESSIGFVFYGAYAGQYFILNITGNILHKGGYIANAIANWGTTKGSIIGNIIAKTHLFTNDNNDNATFIGSMDIDNIRDFALGGLNNYGDIYIRSNASLNLGRSKNFGSIYLYTDGARITVALGWSEGCVITNLFDFTSCSYFTTLNNANYKVNIYIKGEFHIGKHDYYSVYKDGLNTLNSSENGKLFTKEASIILFQSYIIENPSTFEYIYEGEGEPTFEIIVYKGNHRLNYPQETQVAQGVTYGMQNEYEGRLALPAPSTVLKGVQYGDTEGTLEVIALSGATAQADQIAVVNLTEQEVNRVKNCATIQTVQQCFEDFKE